MAGDTLHILERPNSFNVRKVLWPCDQIAIPYVREDWARGHRPTTSREFLSLNPAAQIPVVLDEDLVLRESNAIVCHLCLKHDAAKIYPSAPKWRGGWSNGSIGSRMT